MINLLLGAPGGGKSYEAVVCHVLPALEKGRKVITNLPLNVEAFGNIDARYVDLVEVRAESKAVGQSGKGDEARPWRAFEHEADYGDTWRRADGVGPLYVIDECHLALPKGTTRKSVDEWYSLHRHENADVLLITQSYGKISSAVRDLVQVVYRVRKNVALGSMGSYTRKVQDGLRGEVVNTSQRRYEKKFFGLYRSHTKGRSAEESGAADIVPIWRHWSVYGAALCVLVIIGAFASGNVHAPWTVPDPKVPNGAIPQSSKFANVVPSVPGVQPSGVVQPLRVGVAAVPVVAASAPSDDVPPDPFASKGIHLTGWAKLGARELWSLVVSQNGQPVSNLTSDDLVRAGYKWTATGACTGVLTWQGKPRAVTCDLPYVGVSMTRT